MNLDKKSLIPTLKWYQNKEFIFINIDTNIDKNINIESNININENNLFISFCLNNNNYEISYLQDLDYTVYVDNKSKTINAMYNLNEAPTILDKIKKDDPVF